MSITAPEAGIVGLQDVSVVIHTVPGISFPKLIDTHYESVAVKASLSHEPASYK